jgi:hypothetical protein
VNDLTNPCWGGNAFRGSAVSNVNGARLPFEIEGVEDEDDGERTMGGGEVVSWRGFGVGSKFRACKSTVSRNEMAASYLLELDYCRRDQIRETVGCFSL